MRGYPLLSVMALAAAGASVSVLAATEGQGAAAKLLREVNRGRPDEARAVKVKDARIQLGPGALEIERGVLLPAAAVDGRTLEAAFVGEGWFTFEAPDPIESGQLELFTGDTTFRTPITAAVLVSGDDARLKALLDGERAGPEDTREALKLYKSWTDGAERQGFAADLSMVKALLGDPLFREYFAVWCRSPDHGDFYQILDPSDSEPHTLGQFVPLDMSRLDVWEQRSIKSFFHAFGVFGRFADFSAEHPGDWDTWVSAGSRGTPTSLVEPEHYTIDLYVNPQIEMDAKGSARIRLRVGPAAVRTLDFSLFSGARPTGVFGPGDQPYEFIRRETALHVFPPEAIPANAVVEIRIDYEGDLCALGSGLLSTDHWYPRIGQMDRATYDVTLRRPKRLTVVGSGRVTESGEEDGRAWERRVLDTPAIGFTFEVGRYETVQDRAGHIALTFGFYESEDEAEPARRAVIIDTVKKSIAYFEERFGPYPLDYFSVAVVDRGFSQGLLSMLTLAWGAVTTPPEDVKVLPRVRQRAEEQRILTIAHEVSHQWWGNRVGWVSYHDQWLSEAVASYSALLYAMSVAESKAAFLARNALDWQWALTGWTSAGRPVGALGPITLGYRLDSSKSAGGYQAIVYEKGQVVLRMLAKLLGEEGFTRMLGELAKSVENRPIDTATFLKAIERMSGQNLKSFADQFVYGTGIPEVYYRYETKPRDDGKGWILSGSARQVPSRTESYVMVEDEKGGWRVDRHVRLNMEVPASTLIVPVQFIITPPETVHKGVRGTVQTNRGFMAHLVLKGHETPFEYSIPEKPERVELDQLGEVLAEFHDESWTPKFTLHAQAADLEASGDLPAAESLLRKALEAPLYSERAVAWMRTTKDKDEARTEKRSAEQEKSANARIRTSLARFLVARGQMDQAEQEMVAAEGLLKHPESEGGWQTRRILRSRIDIARGDYEAAYRRLRNGLTSWSIGAEGYALLAIAASASGHDRAAGMALAKAEARGIDVRAFRAARLR